LALSRGVGEENMRLHTARMFVRARETQRPTAFKIFKLERR
jgi:hypothetical protein